MSVLTISRCLTLSSLCVTLSIGHPWWSHVACPFYRLCVNFLWLFNDHLTISCRFPFFRLCVKFVDLLSTTAHDPCSDDLMPFALFQKVSEFCWSTTNNSDVPLLFPACAWLCSLTTNNLWRRCSLKNRNLRISSKYVISSLILLVLVDHEMLIVVGMFVIMNMGIGTSMCHCSPVLLMIYLCLRLAGKISEPGSQSMWV